MLNINYDDREIQAVISRLIARSKDVSVPSYSVGEYMIAQVDERFATETDPNRVPWQPLSARTLAQKRAEGKILKILQRTGLMRSTVNYRVTPKGVAVGLSSAIAVKHQRGTGVPRREILGLNREDIRNIVEIYRDYLENGQ